MRLVVFTRAGTTWTQAIELTSVSTAGYDGDASLGSVETAGGLAPTHSFAGTPFLAPPLLAFGTAVLRGSGATWTRVSNDGPGNYGALSPTVVVSESQTAVESTPPAVWDLVATLPNGTACTSGAQCETGDCVDGVCCDSPCCAPGTHDGTLPPPYTGPGGSCLACTAALNGGDVDGACGVIAAGTNPRGQCTVDAGYPSSCKSDGLCDGAGACRAFAIAGTSCDSSTCAANALTGQACNGSGSRQTGTFPCAPYVCDAAGKGCTTSCAADTDCGDGAYCDGGLCEVTLEKGATCTKGDECSSGLCVDGVCCDSSCGGQCQSCDVPGSVGACATVSGPPTGGRAACVSDGSSCAGACDGVHAAACSHPTVGASCGAGCTDGETQTCDGAGNGLAPVACPGDLACASDGTTCRATCAATTDCGAGFICASGQCVPPTATCSSDRSSSIPPVDGGVPQECAPYLCGPTGACLTSCATTAGERASGAICDTTTNPGQCLVVPAASGGGGCAMAARGARASWWPSGACAIVALRARRRRRSARGARGATTLSRGAR